MKKREREIVKRGDQEGMALMLALLFVVLLAAIVVSLSYEMQVEAAFVEAHSTDFTAYIAAKSGVAAAMAALAVDVGDGDFSELLGQLDDYTDLGPELDVDSREDEWAKTRPPRPLNDGMMSFSVDDEYGKLNLNALISIETKEPNELLVQALRLLFERRDIEDESVDAILDWLDRDDLADAGGGDMFEEDYYSGLEIPFGCKNGRMDSIEELLLIPGITPEVYFGITADEDDEEEGYGAPLTELLTVHGHPYGDINVNTAEIELVEVICEAAQDQGWADALDFFEEVKIVLQPVDEDDTELGHFKDDLDRILKKEFNFPGTRDRQESEIRDKEDDKEDEEETQRGGRPTGDRDRNRNESGAEPLESGFIAWGDKFRIRGDGMAHETRVRIEAYVWRDRELAEQETLYILDWRVIR